jgi:hypothetical protein
MMKDRTQFWINLIVSVILPLVLSGGGASLLVYLKEDLPNLLYIIILWLLWLFIIAILFRLAFGDLIDRFRFWIKQNLRHRAEKKIVHEWYEKWQDFCELLRKVVRTDWEPTKKQENEYSELHSWFITNRSKFLPVWHGFNTWRSDAAHEDEYNGTASLKWQVFQKSYKDPFSYFYEPFRLEDLGNILGYHKPDVGDVLKKLEELMDECIEWAR